MDITSFVLGLMKGRKSGKGFYSTEENEAGGMTYSFSATEAGGDDGDIGAEKYIEARYAEVVLPNAKSLKPYAFYDDDVLTHIEMPKMTSIGRGAFQRCYKLAITSLPSGVTHIEDYAFNGCSGITAITFEGKPTTIGKTAFNSCNNLTTINVPWAEGEVASAPWGATNATINYNYTGG